LKLAISPIWNYKCDGSFEGSSIFTSMVSGL